MSKSTDARLSAGESREVDALINELAQLREDMIRQRARLQPQLAGLPGEMRASARNLVDYMTLRRHDLRRLQEQLTHYGVSSLGRAEANVMTNLDVVLRLLLHARRRTRKRGTPAEVVTHEEGRQLLAHHTQALLGKARSGRRVSIMVTMPSEAATDYGLVSDLLSSGMDVMRINCAHDGPVEWEQMVRHLERAKQESGLDCRVLMDLAGPKPRTGPIADGPRVVKWRPLRDVCGLVVQPAHVWLTPAGAPEPPPQPADAQLPLATEFLAAVGAGDVVRFRDARGKKRTLRVVEAVGSSAWAQANDTAYIADGTELSCMRDDEEVATTRIEGLPPLVETLHLRRGDEIVLVRAPIAGQPAVRDGQDRVVSPARVSCTLPEVLDDVKVGEPIWFDDGRIGGRIRAVDAAEVRVEITQAHPLGSNLGAFKGINLPGSNLRLAALTDKDLADLPFLVRLADLVGYSFVRTEHDVRVLLDELARVGGIHLGVVLKIETRRAFEELPNLLLAVMQSRAAGVMIARGDLAVECGFERLAEIQEEILWLSESAHMPVIWATQVLESMTRDGMPSRAEVTDAAMAERAECVMLNKGPYVVEAVRTLDDILKRMETHQTKKRSMLRRLRLAETFFNARRDPPRNHDPVPAPPRQKALAATRARADDPSTGRLLPADADPGAGGR